MVEQPQFLTINVSGSNFLTVTTRRVLVLKLRSLLWLHVRELEEQTSPASTKFLPTLTEQL